MKNLDQKRRLKREIAAVMRSMDFVSEHPVLAKGGSGREAKTFAAIYQQLALAWEHLALQCRHWDGFKAKRGGTPCCPICGLVEGAEEQWVLLPRNSPKAIGRMTRPTSKETFATKNAATVLDDSIEFHGANLRVEVRNAYRSTLFKEMDPKLGVSVIADRSVQLLEEGVSCEIDQHMIQLSLPERSAKDGQPFGAFPWELTAKELKRFPVILERDRAGRFVGLTVFRPEGKPPKRAGRVRSATPPVE